MFDRSAACTGQDRSVASKLRGSRQAFAGIGGEGSRGRVAGKDRGERQDRPLPLYPDTRMCLIWQKLQMLNCCRAGVAAQAEVGPSPPLPTSRGDPERGVVSRACVGAVAFAVMISATQSDCCGRSCDFDDGSCFFCLSPHAAYALGHRAYLSHLRWQIDSSGRLCDGYYSSVVPTNHGFACVDGQSHHNEMC